MEEVLCEVVKSEKLLLLGVRRLEEQGRRLRSAELVVIPLVLNGLNKE